MDPNLNPPGQFPVCKEKVTFTIGIPRMPQVIDYKDNSYTKALEEKMNCDIQFEFFPESEATQKVELMVAAGGDDLPDILVGMYLTDKAVATYGKNGMIVPLNDYYEKSSYYLKQVVEKEGQNFLNMITMDDGNIYVVPTYNKILQNELAVRLWIYQPWLDKLGLQKPTNTTEFKNVLTAFKENDLNGNGKQDEIPFIGSSTGWTASYFLDFFMSAFVYADRKSNYLYLDNGQIKAAYLQPEWKDGINYLHDLCKNGLLSPSSFTITLDQFNQIVANANGVIAGSFVHTEPSSLTVDDPRRTEYKCLPPLEGPKGVKYAVYTPSMPNNNFVITKTCKNPEAAFRMGDIMCSEEMTIHTRFGQKGVDWVPPEEGDKGAFESLGYPPLIKPIMVWGQPQKANWQNQTPGYRDYHIGCGLVGSDPLTIEGANVLPDYIAAKPKEVIGKIIYTEEELDTISEIQTAITSYLNDMTAQYIVGTRDINADWENFQNTLKNMGVDQLLKITQQAYNRTNRK